MTYRLRIPAKPSKRQIQAQRGFLSLGTADETPIPEYRAPVKRGKSKRQKEERVNDTVRSLLKVYRNVHLYRNSRGPAYLPNGQLITRGIGPNGFPDFVGYVEVLITPDMVGRTIAQFAAPESKTEATDLDGNQHAIAVEIINRGGKAGVIRTAEDFVSVLGLELLRG